MAGVAVSNAQHAVVTLLARVNGKLMELGVPIYYASGALAVSGEPAWLPAPQRATVPSPAPGSTDPATQAELMSQLPAFFQAYASGNQDTLGRFLAPGTSVTGLGDAVTFGSLVSGCGPGRRNRPERDRHRGMECPWPGQRCRRTADIPAGRTWR